MEDVTKSGYVTNWGTGVTPSGYAGNPIRGLQKTLLQKNLYKRKKNNIANAY